MEYLQPMVDFVLEQGNPNNTDSQFADKIMACANLFKQPSNLGMFVACDKNGNVLEKPKCKTCYTGTLDDCHRSKEWKILRKKLDYEI